MSKKRFDITGMSCAACAARVEKSVSGVEGVDSCSVNLLKNNMVVEYDPGLTSDKEIIVAVVGAGYGASVSTGVKENNAAAEETAKIKKRLILSLIFDILLMGVAMGSMALSEEIYCRYSVPIIGAELALVIPIIVINFKYFASGSRALLSGAPNMDTLVATGACASVLYSVYAFVRVIMGTASGDMGMIMEYSHNVYFEGAGTILTLITLGKFLESRAKSKTSDAINKLMDLRPKTAARVESDGSLKIISADDVVKGDILQVRSGETVPVDGIVIEGRCAVDESALTGESIPSAKQEGDTVTGATTVTSGYIKMEATEVGEGTVFARIIKLVDEATSSKAPVAKIADKVAGIFVPVVMGIALVTLIVWLILGAGFEFALTCAVSVLVVSCPCALGLATPTAIMCGTGRGAELGILFKSAEALEILHSVDTVVWDKTGTITYGKPKVTAVHTVNAEETEVIKTAYSLEVLSEHPLAQAVTDKADSMGIRLCEVKDFAQTPGVGIEGKIDGARCYAANSRIASEVPGLTDEISSWDDKVSGTGATAVFVIRDNKLLGVIGIEDEVRPSAAPAVSRLAASGVTGILLTGDNRNAAKAVAAKAGIDEVIAEVFPQDKEKIISELKAKGHKVVMTGDGINDAPALATADIGIAIGSGTDIAMETSDVVLMRGDLKDIPTAIKLSRAVMRNIKQNLFWAFFYNVICIPVAAGCFYYVAGLKLNPMLAALAMSFSSVFVVTNALRLKRFADKDRIGDVKGPEDQIKEDMTIKENDTMRKELSIEGMMCQNCVKHATKALESIEGVSEVEVDLESGTAKVTVTDAVTDDMMISAITEEGYKVTGIRII
ncbi:MAG: heavy metal translocating P-type ATPase [Clostridiales bacterium]|nr:heavy metal translocating P-type ATPase [Clostridiales bacterium]